MGKPSKAVMDFMSKYSIDSDEIWEVHGSTWVVKHKALERVAVEQGIIWLRPSVQVCDVANKIAVICAFGKLGEREEWSFGEAAPSNNKNSYPMAMAEKRARDRVVLKLLAAHGSLYSEAEADEFEEKRQNPHVTRPEDVFEPVEYDQNGQPVDNIPLADTTITRKLRVADQRPIFERLQANIQAMSSVEQLKTLVGSKAFADEFALLKSDWQEFLRGVYGEHQQALRDQDAQDNERLAS